MAQQNNDLVGLATGFASQDTDLYSLLGVDALTPKEDIHRAWRKRSLRHHPDKAGDRFDAQTWELLEQARDVLSEEGARAAYDAAVRAKVLRKQEREAMDRERRALVDDLEAREGAARRAREEQARSAQLGLAEERERLAEEQRAWEEEARRTAEEAAEREDLEEARRRVREKRGEKARRRQARMGLKMTGVRMPTLGPANGVVDVPGDYVAGGEANRRYWELVCDKLRAVQAVRALIKEEGPPSADVLREAERGVELARQRIHDAEMKHQREMPTT